MSRRNLILALKAATTLVFGWILWRVARSPEFGRALRGVDGVYVGLSLAMSALMVSASCLKWWVLLRAQGRGVRFRRLLRYYLIGYYFTCLLPSNIGGDVVRSLYAGREIGSQSDAAVSVLLERLTGLAVLLVLVVLCPLGRPGLVARPAIWIPATGALALLALMAALVRVRRPLTRLTGWVRGSRLPGRVGLLRGLEAARERALRFHRKLTTAVWELKRRPRTGMLVLLLTLLFYGLSWVNVYISFRAFGHAVPLEAVAAVLPTAMVVAMLPVAPLAGLGLAEGSYVYYFGLIGIGGGAALAMGLLLRCKLLLLGTLGLVAHVTLKDRVRGPLPVAPGIGGEESAHA